MPLTQLNHVTVRTDDLEGTRDFYQDVLGLKDGPRPPLEICHDVLGLPQASRTVAERLVLALLGADPRFAFDVDGRWGAVVEAGLG
jgi:catechol 2,3-dioxygenase-like lactoylglutathione lyase family enzyme